MARRFRFVPALTAVLFAVQAMLLAVDVKVGFDKTFNFKTARTWAWSPKGPGDVKMARTAEDDPEPVQKRVEPVIVEAVTAGLNDRGLKPAAAAPDLVVTYYLLLTTNMSAQTAGQFLPATVAWGLPFFPAATTSLEIMNRGSLVLDFSAKDSVVWRGIAQTDVRLDISDERREALIREGVRDLLKKFPPS